MLLANVTSGYSVTVVAALTYGVVAIVPHTSQDYCHDDTTNANDNHDAETDTHGQFPAMSNPILIPTNTANTMINATVVISSVSRLLLLLLLLLPLLSSMFRLCCDILFHQLFIDGRYKQAAYRHYTPCYGYVHIGEQHNHQSTIATPPIWAMFLVIINN